MTVWRRWVFPILLVLVFSAIAVSLVKVAFFDDAVDSAVTPNAEITDPVVAVERGDVANQLTLQGTVARNAEVPVQSTATGTILSINAKRGAAVKKGQSLVTIKQDYPVKTITITALVTGDLVSSDIVVGQMVDLGSELGKISPKRFHLLATVDPVQLYRLLDAPSSGTVTITGGPKPFDCTGLASQVAEDGTTSVRCAIPGNQVVFPGLPAELVIDVGTAEDVLLIPTTSVKGGAGTGIVWVDAGDGEEPEQREVKLGISDGSMVEVIEGLEEGESIRQFVPGAAAPAEKNCWQENGEEFCESAGANW